jgi:hypothetical protein
MSTTTTIRLFASAPDQEKLKGYFPSSVAKSLFGAASKYLNIQAQADGTTITEIALAVAATVHPSKYEAVNDALQFTPKSEAGIEAHKKMLTAYLSRWKGMATGTFPDPVINEAFRTAFNSWKDTEEGQRRASSVRQFATGAAAAIEEEEEDPFLQLAAGARAADKAARSTGRQATMSSKKKLDAIQQAAAGKKSIPASKIFEILGES